MSEGESNRQFLVLEEKDQEAVIRLAGEFWEVGGSLEAGNVEVLGIRMDIAMVRSSVARQPWLNA